MIVLRLIEYHPLMPRVKGSLGTNFQPLSGTGDDETRHEMNIDHSLVVGTESARILVLGPHLLGQLWVYLMQYQHHGSRWPICFQKPHLWEHHKGSVQPRVSFARCSSFSSGQARLRIPILQTGQQNRFLGQATRFINGLAGRVETFRLLQTLSRR